MRQRDKERRDWTLADVEKSVKRMECEDRRKGRFRGGFGMIRRVGWTWEQVC